MFRFQQYGTSQSWTSKIQTYSDFGHSLYVFVLRGHFLNSPNYRLLKDFFSSIGCWRCWCLPRGDRQSCAVLWPAWPESVLDTKTPGSEEWSNFGQRSGFIGNRFQSRSYHQTERGKRAKRLPSQKFWNPNSKFRFLRTIHNDQLVYSNCQEIALTLITRF